METCGEANGLPTNVKEKASPRAFGESADPTTNDGYGLPEQVTRQWIVMNSGPDEGLGNVPIPTAHRDGLFTHAEYEPACDHLTARLSPDGIGEECNCYYDESVPWKLVAFSG
jgi:hypothetical protein